MILEHAEVPGRHGEAIVEATLAAAGDMYEGAIKNGLACLAHVKPPEHHGLDQASGLRDAKDQRAGRRPHSLDRVNA